MPEMALIESHDGPGLMLEFELNELYFHLKEKLLSFLKLDAAELGLHVMRILRSLLQIASHPNTY